MSEQIPITIFCLLIIAVGIWLAIAHYKPEAKQVEEPQPERLCKDCQWYEAHQYGEAYDKCTNPKTMQFIKRDNVRGEHRQYTYCNVHRAYGISCGPQGKFYEPKETS